MVSFEVLAPTAWRAQCYLAGYLSNFFRERTIPTPTRTATTTSENCVTVFVMWLPKQQSFFSLPYNVRSGWLKA